jgi:ubiquinol-cytochrome c reductase cytochrome c1 subunit
MSRKPDIAARMGIRMMKTARFALVAVAALSCMVVVPARAQDEAPAFEPKTPERQSWSFAGPFGIYDTAQL